MLLIFDNNLFFLKKYEEKLKKEMDLLNDKIS